MKSKTSPFRNVLLILIKDKNKHCKFPQILQVTFSCIVPFCIFNSICLSFLKKSIQGPHCNRRSFIYNLVDDRCLELLWQVFSHCFCWSDKKHTARKECGELKFFRIDLKHPFEMRISIKKHFGKRWGWGKQSLKWKYCSVKQIFIFEGDYIHCALIYSALLLSLKLFSATIHMMALGSPGQSQWKQFHVCSWWIVSIYCKIRNKSLLRRQRNTESWRLKKYKESLL